MKTGSSRCAISTEATLTWRGGERGVGGGQGRSGEVRERARRDQMIIFETRGDRAHLAQRHERGGAARGRRRRAGPRASAVRESLQRAEERRGQFGAGWGRSGRLRSRLQRAKKWRRDGAWRQKRELADGYQTTLQQWGISSGRGQVGLVPLEQRSSPSLEVASAGNLILRRAAGRLHATEAGLWGEQARRKLSS
jgi:hypothetical protein